MKKLLSIFICALFFCTIFLPLGALIACAFGYSFVVFSYSFFAVVIAAEAATALILSFFCEAEQIKRVYTAFVAFLPILIIVNCGVSSRGVDLYKYFSRDREKVSAKADG